MLPPGAHTVTATAAAALLLLLSSNSACASVSVPAVGAQAGGGTAKPKLNWKFSGVLNQVGRCTGVGERPSCADVTPANSSLELAANPDLNGGTIVSKPVGPYNDKDFVSFSNLDDFQVTPFFNETVCYLLEYQAPGGGGPQNAKFTSALYAMFGIDLILEGMRPAFEVYYAAAVADGRTATVDGTACTVYRYDCAKHPDADPDCRYYDFCMSAAGHVLALNSSRTMGTADPNVKLHIYTDLTVNGPLDPAPPASAFAPPVPAADCLDLKAAAFTALPPDQAHAHARGSQVNDPRRIDAINAEAATLGWVAGPSPVFRNWTVGNASVLSQASWRFGPLELAPHYNAAATTIPASFDARKNWPACKSMAAVRNQGQCGSCWAFAAMESLADRFCVADSSKYGDLSLSAQYALGCDTAGNGCDGGFIDEVWGFLRDHGTTTETCDGYKHCQDPAQPSCGGDPPPAPGQADTCDANCDSGQPIGPADLYFAASAYAVAKPGDVAGIQAEVVAHGPVEVGFYVFSDFMNYQSGVYKRTPSAQGPTGKHAVKIVGWGSTEAGLDYWTVANSWSPEWGEDGFFRIARSTNECGIEMVPAAGLPKL